MEPYNALVQIRLTTSKTKRDILLPHESPNELRLKILGNQKILEKSQLLVETYPGAQSPLQKLNFGNISQKTRKSRYQTFLARFSFTGFLYFAPNILSRIAVSS